MCKKYVHNPNVKQVLPQSLTVAFSPEESLLPLADFDENLLPFIVICI
jgi:hypothetical protein